MHSVQLCTQPLPENTIFIFRLIEINAVCTSSNSNWNSITIAERLSMWEERKIDCVQVFKCRYLHIAYLRQLRQQQQQRSPFVSKSWTWPIAIYKIQHLIYGYFLFCIENIINIEFFFPFKRNMRGNCDIHHIQSSKYIHICSRFTFVTEMHLKCDTRNHSNNAKLKNWRRTNEENTKKKKRSKSKKIIESTYDVPALFVPLVIFCEVFSLTEFDFINSQQKTYIIYHTRVFF